MKTLSMESSIEIGKNKEVMVSDLVNIKGKIFSLIKDGYYFDDKVLKAAHISKAVRDVKVSCCVRDKISNDTPVLPKDTANVHQILSELNTIIKNAEKVCDEDGINGGD